MNPTQEHQSHAITAALIATLVIHATVAAGVLWGGWLKTVSFPSAPKKEYQLVTLDLSQPPPTLTPEEPPIKPNIFVPVPPEAATPEPPKKETPFYSNKNSQAAQPEAVTTPDNKPKLNGETTTSSGTINAPNPTSLQTKPQPASQPSAGAPSQPRPQTSVLSPSSGSHTRPIPITPITPASPRPPANLPKQGLQKATANHPNNQLPAPTKPSGTAGLLPTFQDGPKAPTLQQAKSGLGSRNMKTDNAGTARTGAPALDVRLTGYGDYDARFFAAISIAWRKQIKDRSWAASTVKMDFNLHADGRIDNVQIHDTRAASILQFFCREAIEQPAPFEPWSNEMRTQLGPGPRRCRITFNYLVR